MIGASRTRGHRAEIAAIGADPAVPDFANTVEALERSARLLRRLNAEAPAEAKFNIAELGEKIGAESSTNKIVWSELDLLINETAMRILGARGELRSGAPLLAADEDGWLEGFLFAQAGPIYAGTNEIQRNIIAGLALA